jgi:uncharacterized cupredoxin-like copper-binding protein
LPESIVEPEAVRVEERPWFGAGQSATSPATRPAAGTATAESTIRNPKAIRKALALDILWSKERRFGASANLGGRMGLKSGLRIATIIAAVAAIAAPVALARPTTTEPGVLYKVRVTVTDTKITVGHSDYVRGAVIQYRIRNLGTKPHAFMIGDRETIKGERSPTIKPGGTGILLVVYQARGRYDFFSPLRYDRAKPGMRGSIVIS